MAFIKKSQILIYKKYYFLFFNSAKTQDPNPSTSEVMIYRKEGGQHIKSFLDIHLGLDHYYLEFNGLQLILLKLD